MTNLDYRCDTIPDRTRSLSIASAIPPMSSLRRFFPHGKPVTPTATSPRSFQRFREPLTFCCFGIVSGALRPTAAYPLELRRRVPARKSRFCTVFYDL